MKNILAIIIAVSFLTAASSCSRCVTCKKGGQKTKICDKDWNGDNQQNQVDFYEALGWNCHESAGAYINE